MFKIDLVFLFERVVLFCFVSAVAILLSFKLALYICTVKTCCNSILICTFKKPRRRRTNYPFVFKNSKMWETAKEHSIQCPNCQIAKFFDSTPPKKFQICAKGFTLEKISAKIVFDIWEPNLNCVSQILVSFKIW